MRKSFIYANFGPLILKQLESEPSYESVFSGDIADIIQEYAAGDIKPEDFEKPSEFLHDVINPVMDAFIGQAYPQALNKPDILNWLCKQYLEHRHNGKPILAEDLYKIKEDIEYFEGLKKSKRFKDAGHATDLLKYRFSDLQKTLQPFLDHKNKKISKRQELKMTLEEKNILEQETTVLYDGADGRVVIPHTPRASQYWGSNTKWCIAGKYADTHFPAYNKKSPVIIITPKGEESNKVALVDNELYDATDKERSGLFFKHSYLLDKCLDKLSPEVKSSIQQWIPEEVNNVLSVSSWGERFFAKNIPKEWHEVLKGCNSGDISGVDSFLLNNKEFLKAAVKDNWRAIKYVPRRLLLDREFILDLVEVDPYILKVVSDRFKSDKEIVYKAVEGRSDLFSFASDELKKDHFFLLSLLRISPPIREFIDDELKKDREFVLDALKSKLAHISWFDESLYKDREIALSAVTYENHSFYYISEYFGGDKEIVMAAIEKGDKEVLENTSVDLRADRDVVLAAVKKNGKALQYASNELKKDREIVMAAVANDGEALQYASNELKKDRDVVITAIKNNGEALQYAPAFKKDKKIALRAIEKDSISFRYLSEDLQIDRSFLLKAVKKNGSVLMEFDALFRAHKPIVLEALKKSSDAFWSIPEKLKKDKTVVMAALKRDGKILKDLSDDFKRDKDVVKAAVKNNPLALKEADKSLKENKTFILEMLAEADDLPFQIESIQGVYLPDQKTLIKYQIKVLERILEKGDVSKFHNYARHMKSTWGSADTLFAGNPKEKLKEIKKEITFRQMKKPLKPLRSSL